MRNRGQNLGYQEKKKIFFKSWKSRRERESVKQNLEYREEKEKLFYKILKIERRKRSSIQKSWEPRGEREMIFQNLENREENETWNFTSPAREGKPRIISLREFLEIETLVKDWRTLYMQYYTCDIIHVCNIIHSTDTYTIHALSYTRYNSFNIYTVIHCHTIIHQI